MQKSI
jgi:chromosome segregation ATPase